MHGCTQTAVAMQSAGWEALADQYKFAVLFPEQQTANNPVRCFNWAGEHGDPANLVRGQGENASIIAMIDAQIATHGIDAKRVFVTGLSAGLRGSIFAQQISGETMTTGARSMFMTARLVLD